MLVDDRPANRQAESNALGARQLRKAVEDMI